MKNNQFHVRSQTVGGMHASPRRTSYQSDQRFLPGSLSDRSPEQQPIGQTNGQRAASTDPFWQSQDPSPVGRRAARTTRKRQCALADRGRHIAAVHRIGTRRYNAKACQVTGPAGRIPRQRVYRLPKKAQTKRQRRLMPIAIPVAT